MGENKNITSDEQIFDMQREARKRKKRKYIIILVSIVAVVLIGVIVGVTVLRRQVAKQVGASDGSEVQQAEVTTGSISTTVSGSGTLSDENTEDIEIPNSVEIVEYYVKEGDQVEEGDLIATVTNASVLTAMSEKQAELDALDEEIEEASGDTASTTLSSSVEGRVKKIYVSSGDDVVSAMYENGALILLSLDGYMAVDIETEALENGEAVTVTLSSGTTVKGTVEKQSNGTVTVLVTDNGTEYNDTVTVYDSDSNKIGEGQLYIHSQMAITGYAGTVSKVYVSSNKYGLDDPICTINIETEDESYEIKLGDYSTMDSERYVSIGDGNVYLVSTDPADSYNVELSDMIKHDEIPDFDEVNEIQFAGAEKYQIVYEEESANTYCADDVYFTDDKPLDTSNVDSYLNTISNLGLTDYVTYNASEEEVETYGLADPELTVTVQYTVEEDDEETEETFILNVARDPEAEEDEEDVTGYVRIGESGIIYEITSSEYESLMAASYNDLRHEEILSADFADIYQIDISLEGEDYTITSEEKDDEIIYYYGEEELENADLQSAIEALVATEFTEEVPEEKEEISFTVYLDNENYPEVKVELYRYDGDNCLAVVDGEPVALVARTYVVDLIEAVNAIILN